MKSLEAIDRTGHSVIRSKPTMNETKQFLKDMGISIKDLMPKK